MKKVSNKGFSLIELIIVIAIMAVLVAIIAPNLSKYLAKAKNSADEKNLDEVRNAVVLAASEAIMEEPPVNVLASGTTNAVYVLKYDSSVNAIVFDSGDSRNRNTVAGFANIVISLIGNSKIKSRSGQTKIIVTINESHDGEYTVQAQYGS